MIHSVHVREPNGSCMWTRRFTHVERRSAINKDS